MHIIFPTFWPAGRPVGWPARWRGRPAENLYIYCKGLAASAADPEGFNEALQKPARHVPKHFKIEAQGAPES